MEKLLKEILSKLNTLESKVNNIKSNMVTKKELAETDEKLTKAFAGVVKLTTEIGDNTRRIEQKLDNHEHTLKLVK